MPIDLQLGVTKRFANAPFRVSATLVNLNHWDSSLRDHAVVGADILLSESLWIGAGYNFRRANEMKSAPQKMRKAVMEPVSLWVAVSTWSASI